MKIKNALKSSAYILITILLLCSNLLAQAQPQRCFIMADLKSGKIIHQEGDICQTRLSPSSTFKIALSLMGYDAGILKDAKIPEWKYNEKYPSWISSWKQPHNPTTWIKDSCVWYSQVLTRKLGIKKFQYYVHLLNYGNQNLLGDPLKKNGLTMSWLSSSLKISPSEQVSFLQKFLTKKFPLSSHSYDMTQRILFIEKLNNGWDLYGKTGMGFLKNLDGTFNENKPVGWFVGWLTRNDQTFVFANVVVDKNITGLTAREYAKTLFREIVEKDID